MTFKSIPQMFFSQASKFSKKVFIIFEEKSYTYSEVAAIVKKLALVFQSKGVKKGSKAVIMLNNSPEFVFSTLALASCGATVIPINVFFKGSETSYIVSDSESEFVISEGAFSEIINMVREKCKDVKHFFSYDGSLADSINLYDEAEKISGEFDTNFNILPSDLAAFIYTSGTTGHPKGAMLSHSNLLANIESCRVALGVNHKDRFLVMLPMFHTYTFTTCLLLPTYIGGSMIILKSVMEMKKDSFKKILIFKRPTFVLGVPQVFAALARSPMPKWFIKIVYPVKTHISGGAPLPMEIFEQFRSKFGMPVIEGYGLSEASPVVAVNPKDKPKQGTVGIPLPSIQVKVVGEDDMELPRGQIGELIVKGPNVMQGYWNMPKATDDSIKNGWLFTGDFATIDEDGYVAIVDRKKDLIIAKGMNVYPREIEEVIYTFPGVEATAVIGIPSIEQGEIIAAYIKAKPDEKVDEKGLKEYLKKELANFKQPRVIKIVDNIPVNATGKVVKRKLKEMVQNNQI